MFVAIRRTSRCLSLLFRTVVVIISAHRYTFLIGTLVYVLSCTNHNCASHSRDSRIAEHDTVHLLKHFVLH